MLKKLIDKKTEAFKQAFPKFQVSKNGSLYYRQGVKKEKRKFIRNGFTITKNTLDKLGAKVEFEESVARDVFLLTKTGKLMYKNSVNRFSVFNLKKVRNYQHNLLGIYLIGRKYEWLKDYPDLLQYKFFQSFPSLAEARKYLGYEFISDKDFAHLFEERTYGIDVLAVLVKAKDKSSAYRLLKKINTEDIHFLNDYIRLCLDKGFEIEIPAGVNKLKELHDTAVWEARKEDAENFSKKDNYEAVDANFETLWKAKNIQFERIKSPYEMYMTGARQKHCIGTNYYSTLGSYSFYTIYWKDKEYQIQINQNGYSSQFYGYDNKTPPQELKDLMDLSNTEIYKHKIIKRTDADFSEYPKIDPSAKESNYDTEW
jgi:hypothetical protein